MKEAGTGTMDDSIDLEGSADAEVRRKDRSETYEVNCPLCGGALRIHEGQRSVRCQYCSSALYVTKPHGVRSFTLSPRVSAGKARLLALRYLSERTDGRVKTRHASIIDMQLIHVPFWRVHGRLMGWVCGDKTERKEIEVTSPNPQDPRTYKTIKHEQQPYSKLVFKRVDWSTPACILPYLGLQGISLRTQFINWDIFDHDLKADNKFALPMKSTKQASKDAFNYLTHLATPADATVRASRFHLFDSSLSLYYYPAYFLRYRHGGRVYTITIDGNDGQIIRGEVPSRNRINLKNIFFVPAVSAFLAATYFPLVLIAAAVIYMIDQVNAEGFLPPHRWLVSRLNSWFGGDG